jgi:hypothetical protein
LPEMLAGNFMKKGSRDLREFIMQFVKSGVSILSNFFVIHCRKLSMNVNSADILCVQKIYHRSHFTVGGIIDFLIHFKDSLKLFKWCNQCWLTWNKANGRVRSSDLEWARNVDLVERYEQTVFTFWTTLAVSAFGIMCNCRKVLEVTDNLISLDYETEQSLLDLNMFSFVNIEQFHQHCFSC